VRARMDRQVPIALLPCLITRALPTLWVLSNTPIFITQEIAANGKVECTPMIQLPRRGLGYLSANISVAVGGAGFNLTIAGGSNDPPVPHGRNAV
jgi:hypothetical protein